MIFRSDEQTRLRTVLAAVVADAPMAPELPSTGSDIQALEPIRPRRRWAAATSMAVAGVSVLLAVGAVALIGSNTPEVLVEVHSPLRSFELPDGYVWPQDGIAVTPTGVVEDFVAQVLGWDPVQITEQGGQSSQGGGTGAPELAGPRRYTVTNLTGSEISLVVTPAGTGSWQILQVNSPGAIGLIEPDDPQLGSWIGLDPTIPATSADVFVRLADSTVRLEANTTDLAAGRIETAQLSALDVRTVLARYRDEDGVIISASGGQFGWDGPGPQTPPVGDVPDEVAGLLAEGDQPLEWGTAAGTPWVLVGTNPIVQGKPVLPCTGVRPIKDEDTCAIGNGPDLLTLTSFSLGEGGVVIIRTKPDVAQVQFDSASGTEIITIHGQQDGFPPTGVVAADIQQIAGTLTPLAADGTPLADPIPFSITEFIDTPAGG